MRYILDVNPSITQGEALKEEKQIEANIAKEIVTQITEFRKKEIKETNAQIILAMDVEKLLRKLSDMINVPLSNSSVSRILSLIEIEKSFNAIVLYKVNQNLLENFAWYGLHYQKRYHTWNEEQIVLFYNKKFLPFVVGGKTCSEWMRLLINLRAMYGNLAIPNFIDKLKNKCGKDSENLEIGQNQFKNPLITDNGDKNWSFLPLDVIISVENGEQYSQTLFEHMVTNELEKFISKKENYNCFKGGR